jgi:PKD repeat protein
LAPSAVDSGESLARFARKALARPEFDVRHVARSVRFVTLAMASAVILTACGGDGGGGPSNDPPVAHFNVSADLGRVPLTVSFDAAASSDPDGSITTYAWNFGDGSAAGAGIAPSHAFNEEGRYTVTLTVTDNGGATAQATRLIEVFANQPPIAELRATRAIGESFFVFQFDAAGSSDSDGSIVLYTWNFGDGSAVASGAAPSHTYANAGTYPVTLTLVDDGGASTQITRNVLASSASSVSISGQVTYERVPFSANLSAGLNYPGTVAMPVRAAVIELLTPSAALITSSATDDNGNYTLVAPANTDALIRTRAQSISTGTPSWNIKVLNNANGGALYVLDSSSFSTGSVDTTRNLNADSGWPGLGGEVYTSVRAAAPFALLDTSYSAVQFVLSQGSSTINLPELKVFWSKDNKPSTSWAPATGDIEGTRYLFAGVGGFPAGMYVLGRENLDTDEYDQHVIAHEFQHFLEDSLSRSDTPGGEHSLLEKLDMRLAFSEGFANAFCAMVLNDSRYRDSYGDKQASSSGFNIESDDHPPRGWYSEASIHSLIWDLYDGAAVGSEPNPDNLSLGYGPIYSVFRNELRNGQALTSIFPFVTALKAQPGAPVSAINTLVAAQEIRATDIDAFGTTEANDGGIAESLPLYKDIALNGPAVQVCGSATAGIFNKIGNRRFLKFEVASARTITIRVTSNEAGTPVPDPDFALYGNGAVRYSDEQTRNTEQATYNVDAGGYALEVYEYSHIDPAASDNVSRGVTCMNVTITG